VSRHANGPGTAATRHRTPRVGEGTVWVVADRAAGDFRCYWYGGPHEGVLQEQAQIATVDDAVAWGRQRSTQVRIRTLEGSSEWAGTAPRPSGFTRSWTTVEPATTTTTTTR
jgi:hypothetical protein